MTGAINPRLKHYTTIASLQDRNNAAPIKKKRAKPGVSPSPIAKISKLQLPMKKSFSIVDETKIQRSFVKKSTKFAKSYAFKFSIF